MVRSHKVIWAIALLSITVVILSVGMLIVGYFTGKASGISDYKKDNQLKLKIIPISMLGIIEAVGPNELSVLVINSDQTGRDKPTGTSLRVKVSNKTEYFETVLNENSNLVPQKIILKNLRKGSTVSMEAQIAIGAGQKITAGRVMVSPDKKTMEKASFDGPIKNGRAMFGFASEVTTSGFLLTDAEGKATKILVGKETEFVEGGFSATKPKPITYSALKNGARISLYGELLDSGELKATNISVSK